jgi:hypothetical protein
MCTSTHNANPASAPVQEITPTPTPNSEQPATAPVPVDIEAERASLAQQPEQTQDPLVSYKPEDLLGRAHLAAQDVAKDYNLTELEVKRLTDALTNIVILGEKSKEPISNTEARLMLLLNSERERQAIEVNQLLNGGGLSSINGGNSSMPSSVRYDITFNYQNAKPVRLPTSEIKIEPEEAKPQAERPEDLAYIKDDKTVSIVESTEEGKPNQLTVQLPPTEGATAPEPTTVDITGLNEGENIVAIGPSTKENQSTILIQTEEGYKIGFIGDDGKISSDNQVTLSEDENNEPVLNKIDKILGIVEGTDPDKPYSMSVKIQDESGKISIIRFNSKGVRVSLDSINEAEEHLW